MIARWLGKTIRQPRLCASHLFLGKGDYGFSDFLTVLRFDLVGPAISAGVITVTGIISVVRSEDVGPIVLW